MPSRPGRATGLPCCQSPRAGTGKSHLAQAIGFAVIQQGHRVCYREAHVLLEELADTQLAGTRKNYLRHVTTVALLIIDLW